MKKRPMLGISLVVLLAACGGDGTMQAGTPSPSPTPMPSPTDTPSPTPAPTPGPKPTLRSVVSEFSFANDSNGFQAGFSDFAPGQEPVIAFSAMPERLPAPLGNLAGFAISAANPSNDVFMYVWKLITGLTPNTPYQVTVSLHFATNAPPGCPSGPGENVTVKAGATTVQPANVTQLNRVSVNFDKGDQATGGANAAVLGNLAQATASGTCAQPLYAEKTLTTGASTPLVTSDGNGQLWLVIGFDSGFAGSTKVFLLDGAATFSPSTN